MEPAALLASTGLFAGISPSALGRLSASASQRTYPAGQVLFHEGDPGEALYIVAEGMVKVTVTSVDGREMLLATVRPPEAIGEMSLVDGGPRSASATAAEPTTALALRRSALLAALHEEPAMVDGLLRAIGGLVRRLTVQTTDLVFLDVQARVAKLLLTFAERDGVHRGDSVVLEFSLSQGDLAEMVGVSRQSLNQALHKLAERGWIEVDGRRVTVLNLQGLRSRAGM